MASEFGIADAVSKYGFPIIAAGGMGYLIHYIWTWVTKETKPVLSEANTVLIALIDRIRMLDNDLIRLNQKLNTVLQLRGQSIDWNRVDEQISQVDQTIRDLQDKQDPPEKK